jgi:hypothetical protein
MRLRPVVPLCSWSLTGHERKLATVSSDRVCLTAPRCSLIQEAEGHLPQGTNTERASGVGVTSPIDRVR